MNRIATQRAARPALREAALAVSLAVLAWPVLAQDAVKTEKSQLETVTITAERRVENIKDVPNSVSTINGEKLDTLASGGQDVRFLSGRVPSLNIESSFGRAQPRFYIRGYGNTDFRLNASQPVSVIYDDVVQENSILKGFPVFDQRGVEVVAGPQGTLFGRNTPAGVVKFDSVRPSQRQEGYVSASYGRFGTVNLEGAANLPLSGDWAARISGLVQRRDDWVKNDNPASPTKETEGYRDAAVRLQALYEPHKQFSALFNIHHRDLEGSPRLFRATIIKPGTNDLVDGFNPRRISLDGTNDQDLQQTGGSARLKWDLGAVSLYSITGYETVKPFSRGDVDGSSSYTFFATPLQPGQARFPVETSDALDGHRQVSQEVRLESNGNDRLKWQGGVFAFDEKYTIVSVDYLTTGGPTTVRTRQTNKAWAVFGALNYELLPQLRARAGLRYTKDKKELDTSVSGPSALNGGSPTATSGNTNDGKWNWDASLTYAIDKSTNIYTRYATGFRASSLQPADLFGAQSQAKPEDVRSLEVGLKSEFWDRRARTTLAAYTYEVKNQQFTAVGGNVNTVRLLNAKKTSGSGVEATLELLPVDDLLLTLGGSYNKTQIKDASIAVGTCDASTGPGNVCTVRDPVDANGRALINGNSLPQAPKWTWNLTARYSIPTPAGNEFYVFTDWSYRSKVNFFLYDAVEFTGKSLTEGGVRAGYIWNNGKYEAALFVRNVTDQIRVTGAIDFNNRTGFINDPRTYGVQFKALF